MEVRVLAADTLRLERVLNARPERVWAYLVEPDKRVKWFCSGERIPDFPGASFKLAFNHHRITDEAPPTRYKRFDGSQPDLIFTEKVIIFEAPRRLRISFDADDPASTSEVEFVLTAEGDGTRLVVTHSKLAKRADMIDVAAGWRAHFDALNGVFAGRRNTDFWTRHERYAAELEKSIPK